MPVAVKKYKFFTRKTNFIRFIIKLGKISIKIATFYHTCNLIKRQRHTSKLTHTHLTIKNNRFSNFQDLIPTAQRARGGFICRFTPFSPNRNFFLGVVLAYKRSTDRNTKTKHQNHEIQRLDFLLPFSLISPEIFQQDQ